MSDCRTPEGVAIQCVDTIINQCRILVRMLRKEWKDPEFEEALLDLIHDEDLQTLLMYAAVKAEHIAPTDTIKTR